MTPKEGFVALAAVVMICATIAHVFGKVSPADLALVAVIALMGGCSVMS